MKLATTLCLISLFVLPLEANAQIVPPKPGVEMPQAYFDAVARDKTAFQFRNAWIQKAERIKQNREAFLARPENRGIRMSGLPDHIREQVVVAGTVRVPVFMGKYANTGSAPYPAGNLQTQLFDGPWPTGTMSQLYAEMSNGNITLTGTVYSWVTVSQDDTYYEGGCSGLCGSAKTGQFMKEVLEANDAAVDFSQYDNDGPDGVPNSGDDDGLVDFVAFVHPEIGGECGTTNMWSHRWVVQGWPEFPTAWETNDARTGGGFIRVQDYVIQPAVGCTGSMIEIGVFCHEFGHAFGLPDLYDTDGGGEGIGHHGLMGSGNWNSPTNPAHMCPWSKMELGWVTPIEVGPAAQLYTIDNINQTGEVYQLNVMEEKFCRSSVNPIAGSYSLRCGLTNAEANYRNWPGSGGYGNDWDESIRRDFTYDGTNPVTLKYDASWDVETNWDWGRIAIKVNGTKTVLKYYTGTGSLSSVTVDLTPYLNGSGATSYQIIAEFDSDNSYSDEDGDWNSGTGGPFKLDNISVTGGGEDYATNFEQYEDGWYYDFNENPTREFFLVENRSKAGQFDQGLYSEGLFIWHIEHNVAISINGNSGGTNGTTGLVPAGVMVEEADGLRNLLLGQNRGDAGDACPGLTNARTFDNTTTPGSISHSGGATNVSVTGVSDPGTQMTATMRGGHFAPTVSSIAPTEGNGNEVVAITDVLGSGFIHGVTMLLRDAGMTEYAPSTASWVGKAKLTGSLDLNGVPAGTYDLVVRNPDGQEAVLSGGFQVNTAVPVFIQDILARPHEEGIELVWQLWADEPISGFRVMRRMTGAAADNIINPTLIAPDARHYVDDTTLPATNYEYVLLVVMPDGSELSSRRVSVKTTGYPLALHQNVPNPFNPSTRIQFSLPSRTHVSLTIYDPLGRRVATLVDQVLDPGLNEVVWDGRNDSGANVASGVYLYRLRAERDVMTKKLLLLK